MLGKWTDFVCSPVFMPTFTLVLLTVGAVTWLLLDTGVL